MDYFKKLAGEEITVDAGVTDSTNLDKTLGDYIAMGYREFKLEYEGAKSDGSNRQYRQYKVTARGDRDVIKQRVAKWYPDVLE